MTAIASHSEFPPRSELTWLRRIGGVGTALALLILGASMLLRLTTTFNVDGQAVSALPPFAEQATRLLHRWGRLEWDTRHVCYAASGIQRRNGVQTAGPPPGWLERPWLWTCGPLPQYKLGPSRGMWAWHALLRHFGAAESLKLHSVVSKPLAVMYLRGSTTFLYARWHGAAAVPGKWRCSRPDLRICFKCCCFIILKDGAHRATVTSATH